MKPTHTIPLAIVLGGAIVALAVYVSLRPQSSTSSGQGNLSALAPVTAGDHIFGNPAAPIKIVEYSDFDCTYCKEFHTTLKQEIATEGTDGSVAWVLREFPLTPIHPDALHAAEAAECAAVAGGNDAFWKYADLLFANQPADPTKFGAYAAQAGVPGTAFTACMQDTAKTVDDRINADAKNAAAIGAAGTPYSVILVPNEPPIVMDAAYSPESVHELISQAKANLKQ